MCGGDFGRLAYKTRVIGPKISENYFFFEVGGNWGKLVMSSNRCYNEDRNNIIIMV